MFRISNLLQRLPGYAAHLGIMIFLLWVLALSISIIFKFPDFAESRAADFPNIQRPVCITMPDGLKVCDRR